MLHWISEYVQLASKYRGTEIKAFIWIKTDQHSGFPSKPVVLTTDSIIVKQLLINSPCCHLAAYATSVTFFLFQVKCWRAQKDNEF